MRKTLFVLVAGASLALAAGAAAGGWATAGLAPPPDGIAAGDTWTAEVTLLQHGRTPLEGRSPEVIITNEAGKSLSFPAKPTGKPGVYRAEVKIPSGGEWRYSVNDDFSQVHGFAPFQVASGSGGSSSFPVVETVAGVAIALVLAFALLMLIRRQRPEPRAVPSA